MENVFVTVGTTHFDELVETVLSEPTLKILCKIGCRRLAVQFGSGPKPDVSSFKDMTIETFDFKPSIRDYMEKADLIVSHAGSGSILESLWLKKKLVVVINERLMHNHQTELAEQMQTLNHLYYGNCNSLPEILQTKDFSLLKPYKSEKNVKRFPEFLDKVMGFSS